MANPFENMLLGGGGGGAAQNLTATEILAQQQQQNMADMYMRQVAQMQAQMQIPPNLLWWGGQAPVLFDIKGGEGNAYVARFECKLTGDCFELSSLERPAVERGMRHYQGKWESAVRDLRSAGLLDTELHVALALIKPRLVAEAMKERDLEQGLREAEGRAKALLLMCLTPEQVAEFNRDYSFTINVDHKVSGFPTGAFRINKGSAFNVLHIESGETFCVVAQEKVPVYDQMLTQKLLLENEPEKFFKTANRSAQWMYYPGAIRYVNGDGLAQLSGPAATRAIADRPRAARRRSLKSSR